MFADRLLVSMGTDDQSSHGRAGNHRDRPWASLDAGGAAQGRAVSVRHTSKWTCCRAGLTQQQLAEMAGLHYTDVCHLKHDWFSPTLAACFRLCDALEIAPARLIGRSDKKRQRS